MIRLKNLLNEQKIPDVLREAANRYRDAVFKIIDWVLKILKSKNVKLASIVENMKLEFAQDYARLKIGPRYGDYVSAKKIRDFASIYRTSYWLYELNFFDSLYKCVAEYVDPASDLKEIIQSIDQAGNAFLNHVGRKIDGADTPLSDLEAINGLQKAIVNINRGLPGIQIKK